MRRKIIYFMLLVFFLQGVSANDSFVSYEELSLGKFIDIGIEDQVSIQGSEESYFLILDSYDGQRANFLADLGGDEVENFSLRMGESYNLELPIISSFLLFNFVDVEASKIKLYLQVMDVEQDTIVTINDTVEEVIQDINDTFIFNDSISKENVSFSENILAKLEKDKMRYFMVLLVVLVLISLVTVVAYIMKKKKKEEFEQEFFKIHDPSR